MLEHGLLPQGHGQRALASGLVAGNRDQRGVALRALLHDCEALSDGVLAFGRPGLGFGVWVHSAGHLRSRRSRLRSRRSGRIHLRADWWLWHA